MNRDYYKETRELIQTRVKNPIDFESGESKGKSDYVDRMSHSFYRTIGDIVEYFKKKGINDFTEINILEIGAYRGIVSITLAKLGFNVTITELPEFLEDDRLLKEYEENNISYHSVNLKDYTLPFQDKLFDVVIMCETLEHLNFNPLPVLNEINRVIKQEGIIYLSLPNISSIYNRVDLILGKPIYTSIDDFFRQLDGSKSMIVGIHWREYSKSEIKIMLERLGFKIEQHYYYSKYDTMPLTQLGIKNWLKKLLFFFSTSLKENQTAIASKRKHGNVKFYFSESVKN